MESSTLSQPALKMIAAYEHLPFEHTTVVCPYFINRRQRIRGALRALVGKGSPDDIVEEAVIIALKEKVDLKSLDAEGLKKFLVDHKLGIDCSGFVYYVLDAELRARNMGALKKHLRFPDRMSLLRKLIAKFRPVENTDVGVLVEDTNSAIVSLDRARAGDIITMRGIGQAQDRDHVLLVSAVDASAIHYAHAFQWSTDGKYLHGIKKGRIEILDPKKSLLEERWVEAGKIGEDSETYRHAKKTQMIELRRLNILEN